MAWMAAAGGAMSGGGGGGMGDAMKQGGQIMDSVLKEYFKRQEEKRKMKADAMALGYNSQKEGTTKLADNEIDALNALMGVYGKALLGR